MYKEHYEYNVPESSLLLFFFHKNIVIVIESTVNTCEVHSEQDRKGQIKAIIQPYIKPPLHLVYVL